MAERLISPEAQKELKKNFSQLRDDVVLMAFTEKDDDPYSKVLKGLLNELAEINDKIKPVFHSATSAAPEKYNVTRFPSLLISPDRYNIRFTGVPGGEEGRALIMTIIMASLGATGLSDHSKARLKELKEARHVKVFTSPT